MKRFTLAFAFLLTISLAFTACNDSQKKEVKKMEKEIKKETKKVEKEVKKEAEKAEKAIDKGVDKGVDKVNDKLAMHDYQCPMKCEGDKVYHEPGKCPKCKMDLKEVKKN
jgi:dipeptidase